MGAADEWPASGELLRECPARRHVGRSARFVWHLFRHHRWTGLLLPRQRRSLGADRPRSAGRPLSRSSDLAVTIRVVLPYHLRTLAKVGDEVELDIDGPATLGGVLDALETRYPVLRGTIRDHG